ncbi:uncharacterized protein LOC122192598 isoform X1 [Lagopus leucura]|uniref:uncharacterized protein LOC122192598 isoform X1 n=1 Tax=Lagopus leucura TaxID=30410 RepID=UPI001C68728A|nr:uncharacterized protein LOC122192598 isoform X1 [Lagopus leucura]
MFYTAYIAKERGAEPGAKIYMKAVQDVLSERARLQAGGLPTAAGPSSGRRPSPAVCPRSVSKSLAGGEPKGLEAEQQTTAQLPAKQKSEGSERRQRAGSSSTAWACCSTELQAESKKTMKSKKSGTEEGCSESCCCTSRGESLVSADTALAVLSASVCQT